MDNNNNEKQLQGKVSFLYSIYGLIKLAVTGMVTTVSTSLFVIISVFLVVAMSIMLLIAVAFGNGDEPVKQPEEATTIIEDQCRADIHDTVQYLRPLYLDKSKDASMKVKDYVSQELGEEQAETLKEPDDGFLESLKEWFGINNGQAHNNLKDWKYVDYENSSKIDMHFTKTYEEISRTLYGYVSSTIAAIDNYGSAYATKEKCDSKEDGCDYKDVTEDDYTLDCEDTEEGCSVKDIIEAMQADKKETIETILKEQTKAENNDQVFYIDTTLTDWESEISVQEWQKVNTKTADCKVVHESDKCPMWETKENYREISVEPLSGTDANDPTDPNHTIQYKYKKTYSYDEIEDKEGVAGDIYVPIYLNVDEFLKDQKAEVIKMMTKDLTMTEIEATKELDDFINGAFEGSMKLCNFDIDYSIFGSTDLIGVGNNGSFGDISGIEGFNGDFDLFLDQFANRPAGDLETRLTIWNETEKAKAEGKIASHLPAYQCTTFVRWMFYMYYGYEAVDFANGGQMAERVVLNHPDKFVTSRTPAPGAVGSCKDGGDGHVFFVHSVVDFNHDGLWDAMVYSDGNIGISKAEQNLHPSSGVRIKHIKTREELDWKWGNAIYAVPIK